MTVLTGQEIRNRLEEIANPDKRLVVAPLLEPSEQLRDDQASIDVRLGFQFALVAPSSYGSIDDIQSDPILTNLYSKQYVAFGRCIIIHPHQFILAETLEYLRLPHDLMAYVVGRSTWGRLGLIVATAVGIHPGFFGPLTLELRNLGETPLSIYPGQTIAQLFFHKINSNVGAVSANSTANQYGGASDIIPKQISSLTTRKKLAALNTKKNNH